MKEVVFSVWGDDIEHNRNEIYRVDSQIRNVTKNLKKTRKITYKEFQLLYKNLYEVLNWWTSYTYVGKEKEKRIKKAFQMFFCDLIELLLIFREMNNKFLENLAKKLYFAEHYIDTWDMTQQGSKVVEKLSRGMMKYMSPGVRVFQINI